MWRVQWQTEHRKLATLSKKPGIRYLSEKELDLQESHGRQLDRVKFVETDSGVNRNLQHPRVFYRRELESRPLVVSITGENMPANVDTGARLAAATPDTDSSTRLITRTPEVVAPADAVHQSTTSARGQPIPSPGLAWPRSPRPTRLSVNPR